MDFHSHRIVHCHVWLLLAIPSQAPCHILRSFERTSDRICFLTWHFPFTGLVLKKTCVRKIRKPSQKHLSHCTVILTSAANGSSCEYFCKQLHWQRWGANNMFADVPKCPKRYPPVNSHEMSIGRSWWSWCLQCMSARFPLDFIKSNPIKSQNM